MLAGSMMIKAVATQAKVKMTKMMMCNTWVLLKRWLNKSQMHSLINRSM